MKHHCVQCQEKEISDDAKFCSDECKNKHQERWGYGMKLCERCFEPVKLKARQKHIKYCQKCRDKKTPSYHNMNDEKIEILNKIHEDAENRIIQLQSENVFAFIDKILK